MSPDILNKVIDIVASVLADKLQASGNQITSSSSMESMMEWDSLNFINIFLAVNEAFDIDPDPDDAIHYNSINAIVDFVSSELSRT